MQICIFFYFFVSNYSHFSPMRDDKHVSVRRRQKHKFYCFVAKETRSVQPSVLKNRVLLACYGN